MPRTGWSTDELKHKAIDAAERLIRQLGFDRTKLTDVARELGISHAALYKHFDSKEALLDAVTARWLARIDSNLTGVAAGSEPIPERIQRWFIALHRCKREKILADPELYRGFDTSSLKGSPVAGAHLALLHEQLTGLVAAGIAAGDFRPGDAAALAKMLFEATMSYHHPRLVLEQLDQDREPALLQLLALLLSSLAAEAR